MTSRHRKLPNPIVPDGVAARSARDSRSDGGRRRPRLTADATSPNVKLAAAPAATWHLGLDTHANGRIDGNCNMIRAFNGTLMCVESDFNTFFLSFVRGAKIRSFTTTLSLHIFLLFLQRSIHLSRFYFIRSYTTYILVNACVKTFTRYSSNEMIDRKPCCPVDWMFDVLLVKIYINVCTYVLVESFSIRL